MKTKTNTKVCSICGENYVGWGANPHPVIDTEKYEEARCCGDCDSAVVIPTRIRLHLGFIKPDSFNPRKPIYML